MLIEPAASIAKLGFRKWYERQLIDGHLALVTCILALILAAASLEAFSLKAPLTLLVAYLLACGGAGYVAWRAWCRYRRVMLDAWRLGEHAVCAQCSAYGRLAVESSGVCDGDRPWIDVQCRKCGFKWRMPR
ncbi:MAG: hypothetical protein JNK75_12300 [Betaproteobacteria bacterium]|nr:hypothetical protein [Betaproteobacteria bacterium]